MTEISSRSDIINKINGTSESTTTSKTTTESANEMGKESFLKLLITQMQHQDPLNPMESVEFTSQLAQFTELEQLISLNEEMSSVGDILLHQNNFEAVYLVGQDVKINSTSLKVENGVSNEAGFEIGEKAANVSVHIYDEDGNAVRTIDLGSMAAGEHTFTWDALNSGATKVEDGQYTFEVVAVDADENTITVQSQTRGRVTGVTFDEDGNPWLYINGRLAEIGEVVEITEPIDQSDTSAESGEEENDDEEQADAA